MSDAALRALERAAERDPTDMDARIAFFRARERAEGCAALAVVPRERVTVMTFMAVGDDPLFFDGLGIGGWGRTTLSRITVVGERIALVWREHGRLFSVNTTVPPHESVPLGHAFVARRDAAIIRGQNVHGWRIDTFAEFVPLRELETACRAVRPVLRADGHPDDAWRAEGTGDRTPTKDHRPASSLPARPTPRPRPPRPSS